jgi:hypothetical protein
LAVSAAGLPRIATLVAGLDYSNDGFIIQAVDVVLNENRFSSERMKALLRVGALVACAVLFSAISVSGAFAGRRVALVIGNAKYEHADLLANTINDADAIAQLFKRAGFDVVDERRDVGVVEFKRAVREFLNAASNADMAVVYYSGHGMEVGGTNYLIPVDAKLASAYDVDDEAVPLDRILLATQPAKKLSLIILDACRENPFLRAEGHLPATRSLPARLIGVEPTSADTLIAYAAKAGSLSYDGTGPNSPFTTALVKYIAVPGLDVRIALGKVRDDVLESTGNRQEPFVYGSLGGDNVSLVPAPSALDTGAVASSNAAAADYQMAERLGSAEGWRAFLFAHNSGYYSDLARAQLAKLTAADSSKSGLPVASAAVERDSRPVAGRDATGSQQLGPSQAKPQQEAALEPRAGSRSAMASADSTCNRDKLRLAQIRSNPSAQDVAKFEKELGCESLRLQLNRLAESLGLEPVAAKSSQSPDAPALKLQAEVEDQTCDQEAAELARLRADPQADQVTKFAGSLLCEKLRPQVQRLVESFGAKSAALPPSPKPDQGAVAPAPNPRNDVAKSAETAEPADIAVVCKQEADELSRIRANPDREAAQQFARTIKCGSLKAQAARLLESLGN